MVTAVAHPILLLLFPSFFFISLSLPVALSLSTTSPCISLSTTFHHQIPPFFLIFFTLFGLSTLIFHYFSLFIPHSPNFTSLKPSLTFISRNPATSRCFLVILPSDFISLYFKLHFAPIFATIPHDFSLFEFHLHWSLKSEKPLSLRVNFLQFSAPLAHDYFNYQVAWSVFGFCEWVLHIEAGIARMFKHRT